MGTHRLSSALVMLTILTLTGWPTVAEVIAQINRVSGLVLTLSMVS